jgi:PhnB protein
MAIQSLNPYLNFDGTARQAIALYERALGARTMNLMRYADAQGMPTPPEHADRVMHAALSIGEAVLMISDSMEKVAIGNSVQVCLHFDDVDDMAKKFDALAVGGKVDMALADTFWGARFGALTDAFGIQWLFHHAYEQK